MATLTQVLQRQLWSWYGTPAHPAEWDGNTYGGGKISQRFWEYFIALELLQLERGAVVLDIGGGSPDLGVSLFPRLLAACDVEVIVLDEKLGELPEGSVRNLRLCPGRADRDTLAAVIRRERPTHISCISVLEHASREEQRGIFDAIEAEFAGHRFVLTFEFHETRVHFEQLMTTATLSAAVSGLTRYFPDRIERCPLNSVNALSADDASRLWYPMAIRFESALLA